MLTFSKDREPRIQLAELNGIVDDAVALAHRQADDKKVMLLADLGDLPPVPVDPDGIHQAVFNLIINAIAACDSENGRVNVSTIHDAESGVVRILVTDNGSGIEPSQIKHIFQAFHSSKGQGGTGLGLAASKKIVDELHGSVTARSEPGKGATFEIKLPTTQPQISDADKTHGPGV
jgi:signal transduction histidine kinase